MRAIDTMHTLKTVHARIITIVAVSEGDGFKTLKTVGEPCHQSNRGEKAKEESRISQIQADAGIRSKDHTVTQS